MIKLIVSIRDNYKPLGIGVFIGAGLSNEFTIDILIAVVKLIV